jgi:hypothetical protein
MSAGTEPAQLCVEKMESIEWEQTNAGQDQFRLLELHWHSYAKQPINFNDQPFY